MANSKPPWHACLPAAEAAPCGYELKRIGCGWWYQSRDEDGKCCHAPDGRRQQWRERVSEQDISGD